MQKLVTHFSLRLGLELSGGENCIGFHPILSDCKVRNPQNLAGSAPNVPTSANLLTQKKEQKSLLLEFVIPAGFEPTTHSLEGCCSIQLSYGTNTYLLQIKRFNQLALRKTLSLRCKSKQNICIYKIFSTFAPILYANCSAWRYLLSLSIE